MRRSMMILALALLAGAAVAQPSRDKIPDRHPAYADDPVEEPKAVRTIRIQPVHTFEQRWEPVELLLAEQKARQAAAEAQNQSSPPLRGSAAPLPKARAQHAVWRSHGGPTSDDICARHNKRKVWQGKSWRCR